MASLGEAKNDPLPPCLLAHAHRVPAGESSSETVLGLVEGRLNKFDWSYLESSRIIG